MDAIETASASSGAGADVFFILMGAILVFAMHSGFAFLEVGTVRHKNQVNALVKILADFAVSTVAYFLVGYMVAYGVNFFVNAAVLSGAEAMEGADFAPQGLTLVKFFFLLTFAAAIPAIISGGIAERARFWPQAMATAIIVGLVYPFFEGLVWNGNFGFQAWLEESFGAPFNDFAGSIVVHAVGGWLAFGAVILLGRRNGRYTKEGKLVGFPPSSIPWLALGSWLLCVGWFGFNVMSAQSLEGVSGLVAINSLLAMVGGILASLVAGRNDPGFIHNGALAGLVAVCAGSNVMHPAGSFVVGAVAGVLFVVMFEASQRRFKIDDVLGVWPLHGLCGLWGGIAAGIFGLAELGGLGGVSFMSQLIGSLAGALYAGFAGFAVYGLLKVSVGLRLGQEEEHRGADLSIHRIGANPEADIPPR
ncbi:ammonium transporter [Parvibaculum sp.]|jgi:Amt family ammonium transporter|uniref:ammonium transporter n=1 Tax=Parvibaculum sp. TaxID=2024848 RepID=UPI000C5FF724|nr:ammonium transporter [Parvibaculum sp.]MAU61166.1 ammonium transporter [Parvibaculum sp.]MBO6668465.1 ammonium transporter [Parvibaculum sp.]MBO6691288.1 ammonium transporter [Parvibaculum sp.]MBO6715400.1 ammonium transporter [Parvibaculum sp.]|tara:strand:+ start:426 stop:1682 length:1257 start_codon:yes stop_codon:yes gene_type:complete